MLESMGKSKDVARRVSQAPPDPGVTVIPMQTPSQEPPTAALLLHLVELEKLIIILLVMMIISILSVLCLTLM